MTDMPLTPKRDALGADPSALTTAQLLREVGNLRESVEDQLQGMVALGNQRMDANRERADTGIHRIAEQLASLRDHYDSVLRERDVRYQERFEAQGTAVNAAFEASETATQAAFTAAEKAIAASFDAREKALQAALDAADRAITKAEISIEKRADATYVALGELQKFLTALMPRVEAEARYAAQEERLAGIGSRVDRIEAAKTGAKDQTASIYGLVGFIVSLLVVGGILAAAGVFGK